MLRQPAETWRGGRLGSWLHQHARLTAGVLLALYFAQATSAATQHSVTGDEPVHVMAGYLRWTHPQLPQLPENGVFSQLWQTLPLALLPLRLPTREEASANDGGTMPMPRGHPHSALTPRHTLLFARAMNALLGVALGALIWLWSSQLFGRLAGLLSLTLFAFCPSMLAHGGLATTDMAATLGFFASTYTLWHVLRVVSVGMLIASCASVSLLVITKMSFLVLLPIAALLLALRLLERAPLTLRLREPRELTELWPRLGTYAVLLLVHVLAVVAVLWLSYDFKVLQLGPPPEHTGLTRFVLESLARASVAPDAFVRGLGRALQTAGGQRAFLAGNYSLDGFWWFFPYAFLIKTPLPMLLLMLGSPLVGLLVWQKSRAEPAEASSSRAFALHELAPLAVLVLAYGAACVTSSLNIGHRHMLPIYPALLVLCGAHALPWSGPSRLPQLLVSLLLAASVVASLSIRPHYLAFFNSLVGGPERGHEQLVDSSLDWGQDLPALKTFLDAHVAAVDRQHVYLSYFGSGNPAFYGIRSQRLPDEHTRGVMPEAFELRAGVYCISATMLAGLFQVFAGSWAEPFEAMYQQARAENARFVASEHDAVAREALIRERGATYFQQQAAGLAHLRFARLCAYLRAREPDAWVGYSILVFRLSDAELERALLGPPAELVAQPLGWR